MLNSSATIQAQGNLTLNAGTVNNYITNFTLGTSLTGLTANDTTTTVSINPYISSSTGQGQILSGGDMMFNVGTLNTDSIVAAGGNLTHPNLTLNFIDGTPHQVITLANGQSSGSVANSHGNSNLGPVFSGAQSVSGTITINDVSVPVQTTGVGANAGSVSRSADGTTSIGAGPGNASGVGAGSTRSTNAPIARGAADSSNDVQRAHGPQASSMGRDIVASTAASGTGVGPTDASRTAGVVGRNPSEVSGSSPPAASSTNVAMQIASSGTNDATGFGGAHAAVTVSGNAHADAGGPAGAHADAGGAGGAHAAAGLPNLRLPTNGLFTVHGPGQFLVTTNGPFANNGPSSALLIDALNPGYVGAILGDAFYEQQLVDQQVLGLTGRRYLSTYTNDGDQYAALLSNGVQYAKQFSLELGVALTPAQMALLTSDMVWMVNEVVDGKTVLVPVVYLANVNGQDLRPNGSLIAGADINIQTGSLNNVGTIAGSNRTQIVSTSTVTNSGTIGGSGVTSVQAAGDVFNKTGGTITGGLVTQVVAGGGVTNAGTISSNGDFVVNVGKNIVNDATGLIQATGNVALIAAGNIANHAGTISAGGDLGLQAGGNITVDPTITRTAIGFIGSQQTVTGQGTLSAGGNLTLLTPGTVNLVAANVVAGGNVTISGGTVNVTDAKNISSNAFKAATSSGSFLSEQVVGSNIVAGGDLNVLARNDINVKGSNLSANGALSVAAAGNVSIANDTERHAETGSNTSTSSGFLSSSTTKTSYSASETDVVGSNLSGNTVAISGGKDVAIKGSTVVGVGDVSVLAGGNLNVSSAEQTASSSSSVSTTSSGLSFASGGLGFSFGTNKSSQVQNGASTTQVGSNIGSLGGNVTLNANGDTTITASKIAATGDVNIFGSNVTITAAQNTSTSTQTTSQSFSGFSVGLNNTALTAGTTALNDLKQASQVQNSQLRALLDIEAGQKLSEIPKDLASKAAIDKGTSITASFGSSSSTSTSTSGSSSAAGSSVTGTNVNVQARSGDINVVGSTVNASGDATLIATKNINLEAATSSTNSSSSSQSSGFSIGASVALNGTAPSITASLNGSHGASTGNGLTNVASVISAGGTMTTLSGGDMNIVGSQLVGSSISSIVGGNLNITSLQNSNSFNSSSSSYGVSLSAVIGGPLSGSFNTANQKTNSDYNSVINQAGLFAGPGGFNVTVGGTTNLIGGLLSSRSDPSKNSLNTAALTFSDITNSANFVASSSGYGVNLSTAKNADSPQGLGAASVSGSASSVTNSAIAGGTITVRNDVVTGQNSISGLSRDTSNATNALAQIFDQQKVNETLKLGQEFGKLGMEAVGAIADQLTKKYTDAQAALATAAEYTKLKSAEEEAKKNNTTLSSADQKKIAEDEAAGFTISKIPGIVQDATAIVNSPSEQAQYNLWKEGSDGRALLHGVVGAIGASLTGGSALGGAVGGIAGEKAAGAVEDAIYKATSGLSPPLSDTIASLALNLVSGTAGAIAGGLVGGSQGASNGSQFALAGDQFNRQLNSGELTIIKQLAKGDKQKELLYWLQACIDAHCVDQMGDKDPRKAAILLLENQYAGQLSGLDADLKGVAKNFDVDGLFKVSSIEQGLDSAQHAIRNIPAGSAALDIAQSAANTLFLNDVKALETGDDRAKAIAYATLASNFVGLGEIKTAATALKKTVEKAGEKVATDATVQAAADALLEAAKAASSGMSTTTMDIVDSVAADIKAHGTASATANLSTTVKSAQVGGTWTSVNESMSVRAAAYQTQITGMPASQSYVLNGVKFDGEASGILLDAKGPGLCLLRRQERRFLPLFPEALPH